MQWGVREKKRNRVSKRAKEGESQRTGERKIEKQSEIIKQRAEKKVSFRQCDLFLFKMEYIENNAATVYTFSSGIKLVNKKLSPQRSYPFFTFTESIFISALANNTSINTLGLLNLF